MDENKPAEPVETNPPEHDSTVEATPLEPKKSSQTKILIIALIVLVIVAAGGGALFYVRNQSQKATAATSQKLIQGLGSMTYQLDASKAASVTYDPSSTSPAVVTAIDSHGYSWKLTVPVGALADKEVITLTPFSTVSGPSGSTITTGVSFAPNGLMFDKQAVVTVTPPQGGSSKPLQLYTAAQDGSQLAYADMTKQANTALIFHFSGAGAGPGVSDRTVAQQKLTADLAAVTNFLKTSNTSLATPPNVQLHCINSVGPDPNAGAIQSYVRTAIEPESSISTQLLGDLARLESTAGDSTQQSAQVSSDITKLMDRVANRTSAAVTQNRSNQNAFPALAAVAVKIAQVDSTLGLQDSPILNVVGKWAYDLANTSLTDVKTNHKYSNFPEIQYLYAAAEATGSAPSDFSDQIKKVFTFDLKITESYNYSGLGAEFKASGDLILEPKNLGTNASSFVGTGSLATSNNYGVASPFYTQTSPAFPVTGTVNLLNVCTSPQVQISQDKYGAVSDTNVHVGDTSSPYGVMQDLFNQFIPRINPNGNGVFTLSATDGKAELASNSWTIPFGDQNGSGSMTLGYDLSHAPQ